MLKNYLKTTLRNLWNTKGYSLLNIFGLAVGITAASLIFLWVEDEVSYDKHFPNRQDVYITKSKQTYDGISYVFESLPGPFAPAIKAEVPGIKYAARTTWPSSQLFSKGDENSINQIGFYVDPDFMDIFSLEFVSGNGASALSDINNIVITQSTAERLFADEPALGKTLRINNKADYVVSGIVKDMPKNSSYSFDWLISFEKYAQGKDWLETAWGDNSFMTFVQLEPTADLANTNEKFYDFAKIKSGNENLAARNFLYPMARWRLYNSFDSDGNEQEGRIKYVRLFSIIAWVVLLIACINFMNLATARSEKRAKEVGMRKVVGASKASLIRQFLGESLVMSTFSATLAIGILHVSLSAFNDLVDKKLTLGLSEPSHLLFLVCIILVCGVMAGSYPAFYLSSFNPITTLKGVKQKVGTAGFVRLGLVVVQYAASITLIVCTVVIYQQISHAKGRDMGYDRSQILTTGLRSNMLEHSDALKHQLTNIAGVESVGISNMNVLYIYNNTGGMDWEGKDPNQQMLVGMLQADADFVPTMGMQIAAGRNFHEHMLGDSSSIVINEAFAKLIEPDGKATGKTIRWGETPYTVVGIIKDFVYNDIYTSAEPVFFYPFRSSSGILNIRTKDTAKLSETVAQVEQVIKANSPEYPFEYNFLDDFFDNNFKSEQLIQKLAGIFAVLSIAISCLGLFGLAAFTAERRTKELGIRKVLGASVSSLVGLLNREFVVLVLISCAVAFPIAYWIMSDWLSNYQYHTKLHWWVFGLAGLGALCIALLTVSSQAVKAALANPTRSLRDE